MKATLLGSVCTGTSASLRLRSPRRSKKLTLLLSALATARNWLSAVSDRGCDEVAPAKRVTAATDSTSCGWNIAQPTVSSAALVAAA